MISPLKATRWSTLKVKGGRLLRRSLLKAGPIRALVRKLQPPNTSQAKPRDYFSNGNHFALERARVAALRDQTSAKFGKLPQVIQHELLAERLLPRFEDLPLRYECPTDDVAFLSVVNPLYFRGVEALLLSLVKIYPAMTAAFYVCHAGDLSWFAQQRLLEIYPHCRFIADDMQWFDPKSRETHNHQRVGKLGFLNTLALGLRGFKHVILLDADLLILGDISELWRVHDRVSAGYCFGDREYCAVSKRTGRGIVNSGVISIPQALLTDESQNEMRKILADVDRPVCQFLDRYADQKAWNLFLHKKPVRMLPYNYNCNIKQVVKFHRGTLEGVRVLHYMGPKPWLTKEFVEDHEAEVSQPTSLTYHTPWRAMYRELLYQKRLGLYREQLQKTRTAPVRTGQSALPDTCLIIGNGPSISRTDLLKLPPVEKFCFNWFILHEDFDRIAPDHLVLASHMFFGGWNGLSPVFPPDFLEALRAKKHRPVVWAPFYFKPLFDRLELQKEFECQFFLFEKPFKQFIERAGYGRTNLEGFLMDGRTAALNAAIPIACHLGFTRVVLVGCDCSYQQQATATDYFYSEAAHTSARLSNDTLRDLWAPGGPGQFSYALVSRQMQEEGRVLLDATVGGHLDTVAKLPFDDLVCDV